MIRPAAPADGDAFAEIYNHYILNSIATFEETPVDGVEMRARMAKLAAAGLPWLAAEVDGRATGYAYTGMFKERSAYRYSLETTVYLAPDAGGRGLGSALFEVLFDLAKKWGAHVLVGGISLPNEASVRLHEKFGMTQVACFREVGFKLGRWIDVGYWQKTL